MVGVQASYRCVRGSPVVAGVSPLAAALSDHLLSSHCAACFSPSSISPNHRCAGPCGGTIGYCSVPCMDLDLPTHIESGECCLLVILASLSTNENSYSWRGSTNFPSLGGTCDLRTSLRLYSHFEARGDVLPFLAWRKKEAQGCRLRGLLSNRCTLLQEEFSCSAEFEAPELDKAEKRLKFTMEVSERSSNEKGEHNVNKELTEIAQELRDAALLMCFARNAGRESYHKSYEESFLAEEIICQVFTNGVQVHVDSFTNCNASETGAMPFLRLEELGSAIYGPFFSWINHSCRPNAFYRFALGDDSCDGNMLDDSISLLVPDMDIEPLNNIWGLDFPCSNMKALSSSSQSTVWT